MEISTSIIFLGTPNFAVWSLKKLHNFYPIELVITNPDAKVGRGQKLKPSPVKQFAIDNDLSVCDDFEYFLQFIDKKVASGAWRKVTEGKSTFADKSIKISNPIFVIVAFGQILPASLVNNFTCINLHASLLPKYRGASPIQAALLNGDKVTGNTAMLINEKMDTGPILSQRKLSIDDNQIATDLHDKLAEQGADLLVDTIKNLQNIIPKYQDEKRASYCHKIKKEDRLLDLSDPYYKIHNKVRAIGGYFYDVNKRVSVTKSILKNNSADYDIKPSFKVSDDILDKLLSLSRFLEIYVKPEGKKEMLLKNYLLGRKYTRTKLDFGFNLTSEVY